MYSTAKKTDSSTTSLDTTSGIIVQIVSDEGYSFKNSMGDDKTLTANVYIDGVKADDVEHSSYIYTWRYLEDPIYIDASKNYVGTVASNDLFVADGKDTQNGLNTRSIIIDSFDVEENKPLHISCEVSNL